MNAPQAPTARLAVVLYWTVLLVTNLDSAALDFALPFIQRQSPQLAYGIGWAPVAYYACMAGCFAVLGFEADRLPSRGLALAGALAALLSCALVGSASGAGSLVVGRGLCGIGSAMLLVAIGGELARSVAPAQQARAFGVAGSAIALALLVAPPISHRIASAGSWQWLMAFSGMGIALLAALIRRLPRTPRPTPVDGLTPPRWITAAASGAVVVGLPVLVKAGLQLDTLVADGALAWVGLAVAALVWGHVVERQGARTPWLANGAVVGINLLTFLSFASAFVLVFTLPYFAAYGAELSHLSLAVALTIFPAGLLVGSIVGARLSRQIGALPALVCATVGASLVSVGYGVLMRSDALGLQAVMALSLLSGFARGMAVTPTILALLESTHELQRGAVSAMTNLVRTAGMAFGMTCASVILSRVAGDDAPTWLDSLGWLQVRDVANATGLAFDASIGLSLAACACAAYLGIARGAASLQITAVKGNLT